MSTAKACRLARDVIGRNRPSEVPDVQHSFLAFSRRCCRVSIVVQQALNANLRAEIGVFQLPCRARLNCLARDCDG
jgi:hypothetical protein